MVSVLVIFDLIGTQAHTHTHDQNDKGVDNANDLLTLQSSGIYY